MASVKKLTPWPESVLLAVAVFLLLYLAYSPPLSNEAVNRIHALQAGLFLSLAFLVGSLSRFWPDVFDRFKPYRRTLGVLGALSAASHVFMVYVPLGLNPSGWPLVFGAVALVGFLAMAATSNRSAVKELGYPLWKRFHTLGYLALAAGLAHFVLVELKDGAFNSGALESGVMALMALALVLRLAAFLAGSPMRRSYAEHFEPNARQKPLFGW